MKNISFTFLMIILSFPFYLFAENSKKEFSTLALEAHEAAQSLADVLTHYDTCIWLVDSSGSMSKNLEKITFELERIQSLFNKTGKLYVPMGVAQFSSDISFRRKPTKNFKNVVKSLSSIKARSSSQENVMHAIISVLKKFDKPKYGKLAIFVVTDESGDDVTQLEDTIAECTRRQAGVFHIGHHATFGKRTWEWQDRL